MSDLFLLPLPHKEKVTKGRVEQIGKYIDEADAWKKSVLKDAERIKALAAEMIEYGLIKAARELLETLE